MSAKVRGEYMQQNLQPILPRLSPERVNVEPETSEASPSNVFQPATINKMLNFPASGIDIESMRIKRDLSDREDFIDDGPPTSRLRSLLNQNTLQVRIPLTNQGRIYIHTHTHTHTQNNNNKEQIFVLNKFLLMQMLTKAYFCLTLKLGRLHPTSWI
jgi:organic radical activating enzyme